MLITKTFVLDLDKYMLVAVRWARSFHCARAIHGRQCSLAFGAYVTSTGEFSSTETIPSVTIILQLAMDFSGDVAVKKFQEYLRIDTSHPNPNYDSAVKFLIDYAKELDIEAKCVKVSQSGKIVIVMTIPGNDPTLSSIMLNSHMDVGPACADNWIHGPWAANISESGNIYGRGTQDMKSVSVQYLEALRVLKSKKLTFERTIHVTFVPDEVIENTDGMQAFIDTPEFQALNVGLALDEGLANPEDKYSLFHGERSTWWVRVTCAGSPGHGSRFIKNTAAEKLQKVMKSFLDFRQSEEERLKKSSCLLLGDVTSINMTMLEGGVQPNVVPKEFNVTFDVRIPPTVDMQVFENKIADWCASAGAGVTYSLLRKDNNQSTTPADDGNPWWKTLIGVLKKRDLEFQKEIFSAFTDGRFLRERGYPVIGFSPMRNTPILFHQNDEYLNKAVFVEGIEVYCDVISALANLRF